MAIRAGSIINLVIETFAVVSTVRSLWYQSSTDDFVEIIINEVIINATIIRDVFCY